jgi:hypothetical protein
MWQNPDDIDRYKMHREFVFFREYHEAIKCMSLKDQAIVIKEVLDYMFEGIMPPEHNDIKGVFWFANYRDLRLSKTKSRAKSKEEQTDIKPTSKPTSNKKQNDIKSTSNQNQNAMSMIYDKDKDKDKDLLPPVIPPKGGKFVPPTLDEVKAYIKEKGYNFDAEGFLAFYEANGWVQGSSRKPIKSWKACCVTWAKSPYNTPDKKTFHDRAFGTDQNVEVGF